MRILSWSAALTVAIAMLMAVPAYVQETEHEKHQAESAQEGEAAKAMPMGKMMERCKTMMGQMEQMHQQMQRMDTKLQGLVEEMNSSTGGAKVSAMAAVVNEMAAHRGHMHQAQNEMHGKMMAHMMEHVVQAEKEPAAPKMMMQCPMMKMMGGGAQGKPGEGSDSKEQESHHPEEQ